jgi:hypothetical protein
MPYGIVNTDTVRDSSGGILAPISSVFRNRIINGAMVIDQRNAGASVTNTAATTTYTLDRYAIYGTSASKFTCQQNAGSVTPPAGFSNYMGFTSLSNNSPAATDEYIFNQRIEGFNTSDLGWGTANAKTITISAWVYSSLTGTFSGALSNAAANRFYPFSYTISSASTWTQVSVTIAGDTTGTWVGATNGTGIYVKFNLGTGSTYLGTAGAWTSTFANGVTGSVNILGTNSATFYITGVQLEVGSSATGFEYRQYQQELALCQRYYERFDAGGVSGSYAAWGSGFSSGTSGPAFFKFAVNKRANPTISQGGSIRVVGYSAVGTSWTGNDNYFGTSGGYTNATWTSSITTGYGTLIGANGDSTAYIAFSAEL